MGGTRCNGAHSTQHALCTPGSKRALACSTRFVSVLTPVATRVKVPRTASLGSVPSRASCAASCDLGDRGTLPSSRDGTAFRTATGGMVSVLCASPSSSAWPPSAAAWCCGSWNGVADMVPPPPLPRRATTAAAPPRRHCLTSAGHHRGPAAGGGNMDSLRAPSSYACWPRQIVAPPRPTKSCVDKRWTRASARWARGRRM